VDRVLERVNAALHFLGLFTAVTGLVVLAGALASSRFQRMRESALLRTLGASRRQIAQIQLIEYWMLGTLAALTGVVLAWFAAWALGRWMFDLRVLPGVLPLLMLWVAVSGLTVVTGALSGRRLLNHPPLELLRQES
jgi:putative ABC transport system permease protein